MTDLVATFQNSNGSKYDWTYKNVDTTKPVQEIKEACELLTTLDIFEKNGVKLFDSLVTGKFVTTIEEEIFDAEAEATEEVEVEDSHNEEEKPCHSFFTICDKEEHAAAKSFTMKEDERTTPSSPVDLVCTDLLEKDGEFGLETIEETTEKIDNPYSSEKNTTQIGKHEVRMSLVDCFPDDSQIKHTANQQKRTYKGLLDWLRRKKSKHKEDPKIRSGDPHSRS